ncbi:hypothetical protein LguiB_014223 [Lonicera macranthoides]
MDFNKGSLTTPPPFDGNNFSYWKVRMTAFLQALGDEVWYMVEEGYTPPVKSVTQGEVTSVVSKPMSEWTTNEKSRSQFNSKGKNAIFMAVGETEFKRISTCKTSKEAWDTLISAHEGDDKVKKSKLQMLLNQYNSLVMEDNEKFDDFYLKLTDIVNKLASNGVRHSDSEIVMKILRSLTDRFEPKKYAIEESNDLNTLTPEILSSKLRIFEMELDMKKSQRNKNKTVTTDTSIAFNTSLETDFEGYISENGSVDLESIDKQIALLSKQFKKIVKFRNTYAAKQGRSQFSNNNFPYNKNVFGNGFSNNNKTSQGNQNQNGQTSGRDLSHIQCRKCKKYGHYANNCPTRMNNQNKAHITQTWNDDLDDTNDAMLDDDSDDNCDTFANYIAFTSIVSENSADSDSSMTEGSESEGGDVLNYKKMYTSSIKKCLKLGSTVDKLNAKIETLNSHIKTNAEESLLQCQAFEQERQDFQNKIKFLEETNLVLEKKYKASMQEYEQTKQNFVDLSKRVKSFEKGKENLDTILSVGQLGSNKAGIGFKTEQKVESSQLSKTVFVKSLNTHESQKIPLVQKAGSSNKRVFQQWNRQNLSPYCVYCDSFGHTMSNCVFSGQKYNDRSFNNHEKRRYEGYPNYRDTYASSFKKKKNKSKRKSKFHHSNSNGSKQNFPKKLKSIWVRKDELRPQLKCNVVLTALKAVEHSSQWYLDSGCSRHMSGDKNIFTSLKEFQGGNVTFGDGKNSKIVGKGTVQAPGLPILENVLLVEGLKANLLSISQFCDTEHTVLFSKENCKILNSKGQCVLTGNRTMDNCYAVIHDVSFQSCKLTQLDNTNLWHQRLGHINYQDLSHITTKELVKGVPKLGRVRDVVCDSCQVGKQTKTQHKKVKDVMSSKPLELLHMDLMGPSRTVSLCGKCYILVMVDDFTRFTWVSFLKEKSETFSHFHNIFQRIQNEKDSTITNIRSDRGGEFIDTGVVEYCAGNGIAHEFSAPKTPQQNGVFERKNRTIQNMARVLLEEDRIKHYLLKGRIQLL